MLKATISELKNRLSAYLAKVKAGETVLILDREEPVARLERVPPETQPEDRLLRLERAGLLRRGRVPLSLAELREPGPSPTRSVLEALVDERREAR